MRPELGFMEFVNLSGSTLFLSSFSLPFLLVSHPLIPSSSFLQPSSRVMRYTPFPSRRA
jgi:hypothetical protein